MIPQHLSHYLSNIHFPSASTHKGQNGKVMVIGGSGLFHAASQWSLLVVSRMVDMVFYSSVPLNNDLVKEAKELFHNGIVVPREDIENYIDEADVVLIGPGMERNTDNSGQWTVDSEQRRVELIENSEQNRTWREKILSGCKWETQIEGHNPPIRVRHRRPTEQLSQTTLDELKSGIDWENDTYKITNYLLVKYPQKKWVIDAGALQMCEPALLNTNMILTPHEKELAMLLDHLSGWVGSSDRGEDVELGGTRYIQHYSDADALDFFQNPHLTKEAREMYTREIQGLSQELSHATVLLKGPKDTVFNSKTIEMVAGGNEGMTKGGTGDVLAGLVAGLYAFTDSPLSAAVIASWVNKAAGDTLYKTVGPFFNATDLANEIPKVLKELVNS